jgi:phosphoribosylanthranilate isomerase
MTRIKVCGVTLPDDAARVAAAGADFIGFNFWPKSKRYVNPERAPMLAAVARGSGAAKLVGVFVDPSVEEVLAVTTRVDLDIIQLHGDETPDFVKKLSLSVYRPVWKAIPVGSSKDIQHLGAWSSEAVLLDAPTPGRGGAGAKFDWKIAREARERFPRTHIILAGGLDPENVSEAIKTVEPWAIDVASGIETAPGIKDPAKLAAFVGAARLAG